MIKFNNHELSPLEGLLWGIPLTGLSLIYLALVLWRFDWLLGFAMMRAMLRWGRGDLSYPASKLGAFTGGFLVLVTGCIMLDRYFRLLSDKAWAIIFLSLLPFAVVVAIHDYRVRKETAKIHEVKAQGKFHIIEENIARVKAKLDKYEQSKKESK
jgi:hypothetical protein